MHPPLRRVRDRLWSRLVSGRDRCGQEFVAAARAVNGWEPLSSLDIGDDTPVCLVPGDASDEDERQSRPSPETGRIRRAKTTRALSLNWLAGSGSANAWAACEC